MASLSKIGVQQWERREVEHFGEFPGITHGGQERLDHRGKKRTHRTRNAPAHGSWQALGSSLVAGIWEGEGDSFGKAAWAGDHKAWRARWGGPGRRWGGLSHRRAACLGSTSCQQRAFLEAQLAARSGDASAGRAAGRTRLRSGSPHPRRFHNRSAVAMVAKLALDNTKASFLSKPRLLSHLAWEAKPTVNMVFGFVLFFFFGCVGSSLLLRAGFL